MHGDVAILYICGPAWRWPPPSTHPRDAPAPRPWMRKPCPAFFELHVPMHATQRCHTASPTNRATLTAPAHPCCQQARQRACGPMTYRPPRSVYKRRGRAPATTNPGRAAARQRPAGRAHTLPHPRLRRCGPRSQARPAGLAQLQPPRRRWTLPAPPEPAAAAAPPAAAACSPGAALVQPWCSWLSSSCCSSWPCCWR
jgi:hypothetical protein